MKYLSILAIFLVATGKALYNPPPERPDEVPCGVIPDFTCLEGGHKLIGPSGEGLKGEPEPLHSICMQCYVNGEEAPPEDCHDPCVPAEEEEDYQAAYTRLLLAVDRGDVHGVLELFPQVTRHTRLNWVRGSIQVLDCSGEYTIGNAPLTAEDLVVAESLLPVSVSRTRSGATESGTSKH